MSKKTVLKIMALVMCLMLGVVSQPSNAQYGSFTNQEFESYVGGTLMYWRGSKNVSSTAVSGAINCSTAHDVAVTLHIYYYNEQTKKSQWLSPLPGASTDPGTYAIKTWNQPQTYIRALGNTYVNLEINGVTVYAN